MPLKEQQSEQIPSDVSTDKAKERMKRAAKAGKHKQAMKLGTTEQIPSSVLTIEAKEKKPELGVPEQILSSVSTIETKEKTPELAITEQIPSGVSTIEAKERTLELGITEQIPSSVSAIEVEGGVKRGIKAGKQMNRNLAFLLISVLAIGLVILGVLQGQKPGNDDELSSQLDKSRQTVTELQTQLAASQQDVKGLTDQLTQAQQKIEALQTEIKKLKSPPLTPSQPLVYSGGIYKDSQLSFPMDLKQFENVQGEVTGGYPGLVVYIKDSAGSIVKDFGRILHSDFTFTAEISGGYAIVIKEPNGSNNSYTLQYTIYQRQ